MRSDLNLKLIDLRTPTCSTTSRRGEEANRMKKKFSREELLSLRNKPQSLCKPSLTDPDVFPEAMAELLEMASELKSDAPSGPRGGSR